MASCWILFFSYQDDARSSTHQTTWHAKPSQQVVRKRVQLQNKQSACPVMHWICSGSTFIWKVAYILQGLQGRFNDSDRMVDVTKLWIMYCWLLNITSAFVSLWEQRSNWLLGSRVRPLLIVAEFQGHRGNSLGGVAVWLHSFLFSTVDGDDAASLPRRWIGPQNWPGRCEKKNLLPHSRESNRNSSVV